MNRREDPVGDEEHLTGSAYRVLAVTTFLPIPQDQGDPLRVLLMLKALSQHADLDVLAVARHSTTPADIEAFRAELPGVRVEVVPPDRYFAARRLDKAWRGLKSAKIRCPPWMLSQHSSPACEYVRNHSSVYSRVVLIGESAGLLAAFCRAPHVIWDKANVLAASALRGVRDLDTATQRAKAFASVPTAFLFERRALRFVSDVWVTSEEEDERLRAWHGRRATSVIRSAMPEPFPTPSDIDRESRELVWMSSFRYPPNWEGLLRLLEAADDSMVSAHLTLRVIGAGATPQQIYRLSRFSCVSYVGYATDLSAACSGAAAAVVPLWAGAGVKLKTLTLMGLGVPVAGTPVAFEGIDRSVALCVLNEVDDFSKFVRSFDAFRDQLDATRARALEVLARDFSSRGFADQVGRAIVRARSEVEG